MEIETKIIGISMSDYKHTHKQRALRINIDTLKKYNARIVYSVLPNLELNSLNLHPSSFH